MKSKRAFMTYLISSLIILSLGWVAYGHLAVSNIEEPKYRVTKQSEHYEVRAYEPYLIASVEVEGSYTQASSRGFRLIADYIFGNNQRSDQISMTAPVVQEPAHIAMTAPVVQEPSGDRHRIYFVMPSEYTLETIPRPKSSAVSLREIPAREVAVVRFSGVFSQERASHIRDRLLAQLKEDGVRHTNHVSFSRYNPPGTPPFMNRHEVWVELARTEVATP